MTDLSAFGPDFPFAYDQWLTHDAGLGSIPAPRHGESVAIIGAGAAGVTAGEACDIKNSWWTMNAQSLGLP